MKIPIYGIGANRVIGEIEVAAGDLQLWNDRGFISGRAVPTLYDLLKRYNVSTAEPFGMVLDGRTLNCKLTSFQNAKTSFRYFILRSDEIAEVNLAE